MDCCSFWGAALSRSCPAATIRRCLGTIFLSFFEPNRMLRSTLGASENNREVRSGVLRKAIVRFMRQFLIALFGFIFIFMVVMTIRTQMKVSFWDFPAWQPAYAANPWAVATLYDAYFGFTTFFVWVCFKERLLATKIVWFVLIMALGNIAISFYVLLQLFKLKADEPVANVLTRRART